jgi:hypothetical protein
VKARIDEIRADAAAWVGVSVENILAELKTLAFANFADFKDIVTGEDDVRPSASA